MRGLRTRFERFCYRNRSKGIPNLMLYICIATAIVYIMSMFDRSNTLYYALCFDRDAILHGQVWRLFTYVFTYGIGSYNLLLIAISLFCYYTLARAMENAWGTFRFNLFYLTGILLMDVYALLFNSYATVTYLNLSLFLGYATMYPDAQFLLLFIIPVKAWIFALFDLGLTVLEVVQLTFPVNYFPHNLFPLVAIANYFLFFGKDVLNVLPGPWRAKARRSFQKKSAGPSAPRPNVQYYKVTTQQSATVKVPYTHRCTVCGRTDISDPQLEFRYCSRCSGYHCYCEDHISDHTHVQ